MRGASVVESQSDEANHQKGIADYDCRSSSASRLCRRISRAAVPRRREVFRWTRVWLLDSIEIDSIWAVWRVQLSFPRNAQRKNVTSALHGGRKQPLRLDEPQYSARGCLDGPKRPSGVCGCWNRAQGGRALRRLQNSNR